MDKPLLSNNNIGDDPSADTKAQPDAPAASGNSGDLSKTSPKSPDVYAVPNNPLAEEIAHKHIDLTQKTWDESVTAKPWMSDPKSRLAVRAFSRGIMGAAFFTAGGMVARKWMRGYDVTKSFSEQSHKNPLQFMAKLIDNVVGAPIEATVKAITGDEVTAAKAVLFRPTFYPGTRHVGGGRTWGRSLGNEVVDITFDFFCASVGDAFGRDIVGFFDPNVKKEWMDDKGHIIAPKAIDATIKRLFRYVTYNGGEDWAVAIPYAYFMKGQRKLLNNFSPGFKYDFDQAKNGGSFKMGGNPVVNGQLDHNHHSQVTGTYALEGMLDLQNRFTVYNIGTMMYREMYDYVGNRIHGRVDHLYGAPDRPDDPKMGVLQRMEQVAKWMTRSAVKGVMIMTPSVPFFWITRATQSKHRGLFIHPEHGMMTRKDDTDPTGLKNIPIEASDSSYNKEHIGKPVYYSHYDHQAIHTQKRPYIRIGPMNPSTANPSTWPSKIDPAFANYAGQKFSPYKEGAGISDKIFNGIGAGQQRVAKQLTPLAHWADNHSGALGARIKQSWGVPATDSFTRFTQPFARASMSYTPYMYAKAEFANLWDSGKMDYAAERMIDGAFGLNWHEFKAGTSEVFNAMLHKPFADPNREVEAQRRIQIDTTAPEIFTDEQFKAQKTEEAQEFRTEEKDAAKVKHLEAEGKRNSPLSWKERVVSSQKPADKDEQKNADPLTSMGYSGNGDPLKSMGYSKNTPQKSGNYADQEAMRKALEELSPPTNAIN